MGVMRFFIEPAVPGVALADVESAYLSGFDSRVFPAVFKLDGNVLTCFREGSESARLNVAFPIPNRGRPILSTASLREREEPYLLSLELARGRLGELRDQFAGWEQAGLVVPPEAETGLRDAHAEFRRAACSQDTPEAAAAAAHAALIASMIASDRLSDAYVRQRLAARRRRTSHLPVLLACPLGMVREGHALERPFVTAFTATSVSTEWSQIEQSQGEYDWTVPDEQVGFAEQNRLVASAGPLLDFSPGGLPEWVAEWAHDLFSLQCCVSDFVETAITRYAGRIRFWEISARANTGGALDLDEEHRLALTARAIEVAKQTDDELQLSLRVDRPWGEYQTGGRHRLSPLQFVDALIRSGVGLSAVTLELAVGYRPDGTFYRDRFEVLQMIDLWSVFGLPLTISLAFPSQGRRDPRSDERIEVAAPQWRAPWGEPAQGEWLVEMLPALMSKASVAGIEWTHFDDGLPHRFPHAGLVAADGAAKPALERLTRLRQSYWRGDREDDLPAD